MSIIGESKMPEPKTTVGALLDRFEKGEIELTEMEVRSFKSMPRSTLIFGMAIKPELQGRFAALDGPVPTKAQPEIEKLTEKETEVFEFLDRLRESGVTNMYGAGAYIEREFSMEKAEAKDLLIKWMKTFSERHP
jgi:hypothetical protein